MVALVMFSLAVGHIILMAAIWGFVLLFPKGAIQNIFCILAFISFFFISIEFLGLFIVTIVAVFDPSGAEGIVLFYCDAPGQNGSWLCDFVR